jgi:WD40 repeat protein
VDLDDMAISDSGERIAFVLSSSPRVSGSGDRIELAREHRVVVARVPEAEIIREFPVSAQWVSEMSFDADGSHLAVLTSEELMVSEIDTGDRTTDIAPGNWPAHNVALSPSGDRLALLGMQGLSLHDLRTEATVGGSVRGWPGLAFSPDGRHLIAIHRDGILSMLDGQSGELLGTSDAHDSVGMVPWWWHTNWLRYSGRPVVAFSEDGGLIASVGSDATVAVTDLAAAELLVRVMWVGGPGVPDGGWITWTPDGRYDGTEEAIEACIRFRDGDQLVPASQFPQLRVEGLIDEVLAR